MLLDPAATATMYIINQRGLLLPDRFIHLVVFLSLRGFKSTLQLVLCGGLLTRTYRWAHYVRSFVRERETKQMVRCWSINSPE